MFDTLVELKISSPAWEEIYGEDLVLVCHYHEIASIKHKVKTVDVINFHQIVKAHNIALFFCEFKLTMLSNNEFTVIGNWVQEELSIERTFILNDFQVFIVNGDHILEFAFLVKLTVVDNNSALILRYLDVLDIIELKSSYDPAFWWVSEIVLQHQNDFGAIAFTLRNDVAVRELFLTIITDICQDRILFEITSLVSFTIEYFEMSRLYNEDALML